MKYLLLVGAALVTLAAALLLGPANLPLSDLPGSAIVWQLRLPRAVLAFPFLWRQGKAAHHLRAPARREAVE